MTRAEIIAIQKEHELPGAWQEFAINLPTIVKQEHFVDFRSTHLHLTLEGTVDIRASSSGGFIHIGFGPCQSQVLTLMNAPMQVEAGTAPAIVHPPDANIPW